MFSVLKYSSTKQQTWIRKNSKERVDDLSRWKNWKFHYSNDRLSKIPELKTTACNICRSRCTKIVPAKLYSKRISILVSLFKNLKKKKKKKKKEKKKCSQYRNISQTRACKFRKNESTIYYESWKLIELIEFTGETDWSARWRRRGGSYAKRTIVVCAHDACNDYKAIALHARHVVCEKLSPTRKETRRCYTDRGK